MLDFTIGGVGCHGVEIYPPWQPPPSQLHDPPYSCNVQLINNISLTGCPSPGHSASLPHVVLHHTYASMPRHLLVIPDPLVFPTQQPEPNPVVRRKGEPEQDGGPHFASPAALSDIEFLSHCVLNIRKNERASMGFDPSNFTSRIVASI